MSDSMITGAEASGGKVGEAMRRLEAAIDRVEMQSQEVQRLKAALAEAEAEKGLLQQLLSETSTKLDSLIGRLEGQFAASGQER